MQAFGWIARVFESFVILIGYGYYGVSIFICMIAAFAYLCIYDCPSSALSLKHSFPYDDIRETIRLRHSEMNARGTCIAYSRVVRLHKR